MASLLHHFAAAVKRHPDRVAIIDGKGRQTSYRQLDIRAKRLAARWAQRGIGPGDHVLLAMPVDAGLYASLAALWSLGAIVVLPEPAMGLDGVRHAARVTRPKALCTAGYYALLKLLVPDLKRSRLLLRCEARSEVVPAQINDDDTALISFTSGTSGKPKAIPRSHGFLMAQHDAIAPLLDSDRAERDLVAFPVFTLINLAAGRTTILPNWKMSRLDRLSPEHLSSWIIRHQVTRLLIPPSICDKLALCGDAGALHTVFTGGGPVFPDLVERLRADANLKVICVYGSTEAEPIAHLDARDISPADRTGMATGQGLLVGQPVPQVQLRIHADEVQVAGAHVNDGYLDPSHTKENKIIEGRTTWHRTGDAGALDELGRLWLWGRLGSEATTPTGRVFPFAVEIAARQWQGVEQAALVDIDGAPVLCIQGDTQRPSDWQQSALAFGVTRIERVSEIPMDKRHRSKVDRVKLVNLVGQSTRSV